MAETKPLDAYFSETFGTLTTQNTLLRAQVDQLNAVVEQLRAELAAAKPKEDPALEVKPDKPLRAVKSKE